MEAIEEEEEEEEKGGGGEEEGKKYIPFYRFNFVVVDIVAQCEVYEKIFLTSGSEYRCNLKYIFLLSESDSIQKNLRLSLPCRWFRFCAAVLQDTIYVHRKCQHQYHKTFEVIFQIRKSDNWQCKGSISSSGGVCLPHQDQNNQHSVNSHCGQKHHSLLRGGEQEHCVFFSILVNPRVFKLRSAATGHRKGSISEVVPRPRSDSKGGRNI